MPVVSKDPKKVAEMFSTIAPYYDGLNRSMSLWQDVTWRKKLIMETDLPEDGIVLDLCTGTGDIAIGYLRHRTEFKGDIVGLDFSAYMVDLARDKLIKLGTGYQTRIDFLMGDATDLNFRDDKFDVISVGFGVRNFSDTIAGLEEMYRVLKPGGQANILEFFSGGINTGFVKWYTSSVVPAIGNIVSRSGAYTYLSKTSSEFYTIDEFRKVLEEIGFRDMEFERMTFGISYIVRCRK
jgi:demethylmenaquinone methyltransferase/2-methoxy-6-polyprenyl-1,4-benzoquinol methylase